LLKGWKMLAICCPVCHMALFSKGEEMRCARCDLPVKVSEEKVIDSPVQALTTESESDSLSYEDIKKQYAKQRQQSDNVSKLIGKKLLEGWIMLGDHCTNSNCSFAPLMQKSRADELVTCPVCETQYSLADGDVKAVSKGESKVVTSLQMMKCGTVVSDETNGPIDLSLAPVLRFNAENDDIVNGRDHVVDYSNKISELLLKGWTMLSDSCGCGASAPLMRNCNGKLYCVGCGFLEKPIASGSSLSYRRCYCRCIDFRPSIIQEQTSAIML